MKMKNKDRISDLQDEILCHILSFLLTKEAVATSILSKRWKPLWRSVFTLHFSDVHYHYSNYNSSRRSNYATQKHVSSLFEQSVYKVILSRDFHLPLKKFHLMLTVLSHSFYDPANVIAWVDAAVQGRVEHLNIFLARRTVKMLLNLSFIFTCKTLVVLKLLGLEWTTSVSYADLPFLKVLHLQELCLYRHGCLANLLSGCPVLEDLKARDLYFYFHDSVNVSDRGFPLPKLLRADISRSHTNSFIMEVVNNVHFLQIHQIGNRLPHEGEAMFHNLTRIELVFSHYISDWFEVVKFLNYCPKLQVLVVNQPKFHCYDLDRISLKVWQDPPSVPKCILLHLKECYLSDYRGTQGEFEFARYIMQNGNFLKRMTICSNCTKKEKEKQLPNKKILSSCMRRSTTCILSFK